MIKILTSILPESQSSGFMLKNGDSLASHAPYDGTAGGTSARGESPRYSLKTLQFIAEIRLPDAFDSSGEAHLCDVNAHKNCLEK